MAIAVELSKSDRMEMNSITFAGTNNAYNFIDAIFKARTKLKIDLLMFGALLLFSTTSVYAADGDSFTQVMGSSSFMGSWETMSKFDWMGKVLSWIIVFFSITGVISTFAQMMADYGYLASKNIFDDIYDYQGEDSGSGFLGLSGTLKNTISGKRGVGLNAFVGVGYSLMPNLKKYSSYNPDRRAPNLDDDDTILSYTLKTFIPRLLIILFFTLAFNGTLAKSFSMFAEAGAQAIDSAVSTDLSAAVDKWAARGQGYTFTLGSDGTNEGKFGEKVAKKLYTMIISKTGADTDISRNAIGLNAEQWVYANILGGSQTPAGRLAKLNTLVAKTSSQSDLVSDDIKALRLEIIINTNAALQGGEVTSSGPVQIGTFLANSGIESNSKASYYIHIFILRGKTQQSDFFLSPTQKANTKQAG